MPGLATFAAASLSVILGTPKTSLKGLQQSMVLAHGIFPRATSAGPGSGPPATPRNVAKLLTGWSLGGFTTGAFKDQFYDIELAETAGEPGALFGKRLELLLAAPELARTVVDITIFPALGSVTVEYQGGTREQFGRKRAQHDGPQRCLVLPGWTLIQIADALRVQAEQAAADD